jgi:hypothetical protein
VNGDVIMIGRLTAVAVTLLKLAVAVKGAVTQAATRAIIRSVPVGLDRQMARSG